MSKNFLSVFILIIVLIIRPIFAQHTYYVSKNGIDTNNGLSTVNSFLTLQKAANIVSGGDSVIVLQGNYKGFDIRTGGSENSPIVFKAVNQNVIIDEPNYKTSDGINIENANWIVIDGFRLIDQPRAGIRAAVSDFIIIKNNYCTQNNYWGIFTGFTNDILIENNICSYSIQQHGIYVSNSGDRPIVRQNECFGNNGCGIQLNADASQGGDGIITNAVIDGNILHDNGSGGGSAINLDGVQNSVIYNNLIYNNHATGIALFMIDGAGGSKNNKVYNNTIINPSDARWAMLINSGSTGDTLYNNIFINHHNFRGSISIDASSINNFFSDYNIVVDRLSVDDGESNMSLSDWQKLGYDIHSQLAIPEDQLFINSVSDDFHLIAGSQAINTGTSLVSSFVTKDITGLARPQGDGFDIGAYEYSSVTGIKKVETGSNFRLYQNYPNPFNPSTKIRYYIPQTCFVSLKVYNMLGEEIETLVNEKQSPGLHEVIFSTEKVTERLQSKTGYASGVYICRLSAGIYSAAKKILFLK
ncbi:MAG: right-handed parallel beta-helix repeat-containing protein [Ignavibacteriaceae bacterium]